MSEMKSMLAQFIEQNQNTTTNEKMWTYKDIKQNIGWCETTVRNYISEGLLDKHNVPEKRSVRFNPDEVRQLHKRIKSERSP